MTRINQVFSVNKKAFMPFITAGDPSLAMTEKIVYRLAAEGADLIELGIPFSDPVAEGPVIQAADQRALQSGTTVAGIFDLVTRIRRNCDVPLALMTYMNMVYKFGIDLFMQQCRKTGVDAVIIPDVPFEEKDELLPSCKKYDIPLISLIAPTSAKRAAMIAAAADGFVYCVSSMGVTGTRSHIDSGIQSLIEQVKMTKDIPCAVGFGISTPEQARQMAQISDGVIVGSALVEIIGQYGEDCLEPLTVFVRQMIQATRLAANEHN